MTTTFEIAAPDGKTYEIEAPDGVSEKDAVAQFKTKMWPNIASDTGLTAIKNTADIAGAGVGSAIAGMGEIARQAMGPPPKLGQDLYKEFWRGQPPESATEAITRFIPTNPAERAKQLGVPLTPNREAFAKGTEFLTGTMATGGGAKMAALAGIGGGVGQRTMGDAGALALGLALPLAGIRAAAPKIAAAPTRDQLATQAKAAYRGADAEGHIISRADFARFVESLEPKLAARTFDKDFHPYAFKSYAKMASEAERGNITLQSVEGLRSWMNEAKAAAKPRDAAMLKVMRDQLDDFVVAMPGAPKYREAANLYRRQRGLEKIEKLVERAKDSTSTYTAAGYDTALRNQFKAFVKSPEMRFYTKAEQDAFRQVARGTPMGNVMRQLGRLAPQNILHSLLLANAHPGALALTVPGAGARVAASKSTQRNIKLAQDLLARGYPVPPSLRRYLDAAPAGAGVFVGQGSQTRQ
jgi:hypothetical protein